MPHSTANAVWLSGQPPFEALEALVLRTVKLPVWGEVVVDTKARPRGTYLRLSTEHDELSGHDWLDAFAIEATAAFGLKVYLFDGHAGASDGLTVRALDEHARLRWEESSEDQAAWRRFAKEVGAGKTPLIHIAIKPVLETTGPGWSGAEVIDLAADRSIPRLSRLSLAQLHTLQREREPSLLREFTEVLEDALASADERIAALKERDYEGAVKVRDRRASEERAAKLPPKHPAAEVVSWGGRLANVQLYLDGAKEPLSAVVPLRVGYGGLGAVSPPVVQGALDATLRALLASS